MGCAFFVLEVSIFALQLMLFVYQPSGIALHGFAAAAQAAAGQHAGAAAAVARGLFIFVSH
ncbi:hypothetical protein [Aquitalea magnusonii]|uniref:hypothetical protein n=1 Tax=Aquitalea magnusonii TaxID=332411 RepID=UPI0011AE9645|nr:hypothetical protein [Aquitalea magnusonii]